MSFSRAIYKHQGGNLMSVNDSLVYIYSVRCDVDHILIYLRRFVYKYLNKFIKILKLLMYLSQQVGKKQHLIARNETVP